MVAVEYQAAKYVVQATDQGQWMFVIPSRWVDDWLHRSHLNYWAG